MSQTLQRMENQVKSYQAPHEKLTEEEVKREVENLLSNHLKFKNRWNASDWEEHEFDKFIKDQENMIFKLRRHFFPEKTMIMQVSVKELSNMMGEIIVHEY
jgi:hypothetical protein